MAPAPGYPTVAMIGGGQLARMTHPAAIALGVGFRVLAQTPTDSAAQVVADVQLGPHDDLAALQRLAVGVDVVTFDHEHVPPVHLNSLVAAGVAVRPGPAALVHAQDKIIMRSRLTELGIPCPRWRGLPGQATAEAAAAVAVDFAAEAGWPMVLKVSRGGYDGRGVWVVRSVEEVRQVVTSTPLPPGVHWLFEERVDFLRELSAQVARSPHGQAVAYPVVRTLQTGGICTEVIAPCPDLSDEHAVAAQRIALDIAKELDVVGMLAVELFDTPSGVVVNELAMRPHNSGHWSIDGAVTSQFENHLRAVLDLPLGAPTALARWSVMVNVLGGEHPDLYSAYLHCLARDPGLHIHMYGKDVRPGRKIGHVTVVGDDLDDLLARAHHAADFLTGTIEE